MTRNRQSIKPPKGPTDHDLLLMLVKELKEFKSDVADKFNRIDSELKEFKGEFNEFKGDVANNFNRIDSELKEFKGYVLNVFKRNNLK